MPTTVATALPQTVLTVASPIGATVLPNARPVMPTTAGTGLRSFPPVRQTRPVLTSPTAPQKSAPGPASRDTLYREIHVRQTAVKSDTFTIRTANVCRRQTMTAAKPFSELSSIRPTMANMVRLWHRGRLIRMVIKPAAIQQL